MGDYTGIRAKIKVKEDYLELAEHMADRENSWSDIEDKFPFVAHLARTERGDELPSRSPVYMPDEWGEDQHNTFNKETRVWEFTSCTKNYEDVIQIFMKDIIARIAEEVYFIYEHYEEWDVEKQYTVKNGVLVFVNYLDIWTREHRDTAVEPRSYGGWGY